MNRVFCGVVRDAVGFNFYFSIEQSDPRIPLKKSTFSTGCTDRIARSKKMGSKRHFFDCVRMPDLVSDRKSPFSAHRSHCIRIGVRPILRPILMQSDLQSVEKVPFIMFA